MATPTRVTEPAAPAPDVITEPERTYDPRVRVYVYDSTTGRKLDDSVPETWLDGRFPQLTQNPSTLKGGN